MSDITSARLTLHQGDGSKVELTLTAPGKGLRIAAGSLHNRSSIWRVTAHGDDVYLTAYGLGQTQKMSFHASGIWRHAFLSAEHAATVGAVGRPEFNDDPRVIDRWEEPEGANGWMRALTVWIPDGHLTPLPDEVDNLHKQINFAAGPSEGDMVGLEFAIVRPDEGLFDLAGMTLVDGFALRSGRALVVLRSRQPVEPSRGDWLTKMSVVALAAGQPDGIRAFGDPLRIGLFNTDNDGHRCVYDLRAPGREVIEQLNQTGFTVDTTFVPGLSKSD